MGLPAEHSFKKGALSAHVCNDANERRWNMKKYSKPQIKKHAELKSVTFSAH
jgi:hypothetical protein